MRKSILTMTILGGIVSAAFFACGDAASGNTTDQPITQDSLIKRGDYLVSVLGCDDCHTPKKFGPNGPELDMDYRLAGHPATVPLGKADTTVMRNGWVLFNMSQTALVGPWGVTYAANITPDATGIGAWTETQFITALRKGLYKGLEGSRPLLPPMPWQAYKNLSDDDIKAVFAYLKSVKPVKNAVPAWKKLDQL